MPREQLMGHFFRALDRLVPIAQRAGTSLYVENMSFAFLPAIDELLAALDTYGNDDLGIVYDVANAWFIREDIAEGLRKCARRLRLVHYSDTGRSIYRHDAVGLGTVPFAVVPPVLAEIGHRGRPMLETSRPSPTGRSRKASRSCLRSDTAGRVHPDAPGAWRGVSRPRVAGYSVRGRNARQTQHERASGRTTREGGAAPMKLPAHDRYDWSPITKRQTYAWPGDKRLAVYFCNNIEYFAFGAGLGSDSATGTAPQSQRNYAWRDYGNRVGIWRLFDLFDELACPLAHNINAVVLDRHPEIGERMLARGDEFVATAAATRSARATCGRRPRPR